MIGEENTPSHLPFLDVFMHQHLKAKNVYRSEKMLKNDVKKNLPHYLMIKTVNVEQKCYFKGLCVHPRDCIIIRAFKRSSLCSRQFLKDGEPPTKSCTRGLQ